MSRGPAWNAVALLVLATLAYVGTLAAQSSPQIPLVTGLTLVSALHYPEGDRENFVSVDDASSAGARYTWRYEHKNGTGVPASPPVASFTASCARAISRAHRGSIRSS